MSQISISAVRIVNNHAEYAVERNGQTRAWRRYREFENLRKSLLLDGSTKRLVPDLPPKQTWWASRSSDVVNQRRVQLEEFLQKVEDIGLVTSGEKKIAWDAFFDTTKASMLASGDLGSSTYLDSKDTPTSGENANPFEENGLPGVKEESSINEDLRRIEKEVQMIKSASSDDLGRFLRTLEEDRQESKALRVRVQQLESEVSQLRSSPAPVTMESPITTPPAGLDLGTNRLQRNEDSSASLPSLESDEQKAEDVVMPSPISAISQDNTKSIIVSRETSLATEQLTSPLDGSTGSLAVEEAFLRSKMAHSSRTPMSNPFEEDYEKTVHDFLLDELEEEERESAIEDERSSKVVASTPPSISVNVALREDLSSVFVPQPQGDAEASSMFRSVIQTEPSRIIVPKSPSEAESSSSIFQSVIQTEASKIVVPYSPDELDLSNGVYSKRSPSEPELIQEGAKSLSEIESPKPADETLSTMNGSVIQTEPSRIVVPKSPSEADPEEKQRLDASFLSHMDDEPTPSMLSDDGALDLSDLSAIPIVQDGFHSLDEEVEEERANQRITVPADSKPPLPPSSGTSRSTHRKGAPLVHSQTPIKVAQSSSTTRTFKDLLQRENDNEDVDLSTNGMQIDDNNDVKAEKPRSTEEDTLEAIVRAIFLKGRENETVATFGCKSIMNLSTQSPSKCERLGRLGACEAVVLVMTNFPMKCDIQIEACGAICNLAMDEWNARELRRCGVFRAIISCLSTFGQVDQTLAFVALSASLNLFVDRESAKKFSRLGGSRVTVECLSAWGEINPAVALEGCVMVRNLAEDLSTARELGQLGACEAVMCAMESFGSTRRDNALEGFIAIRNLSIDETNRRRLLELSSPSCLVEAMDKFGREDSLLAIHACLAVRNLASKNEFNAKALADAGLCSVLLSIGNKQLKSSEDQEELFYAICASIWNLAFDGSVCRMLIKQQNVGRFLVDVLKVYGTKSPKCSLIACGAVYRLVATDSLNSKKELIKAGIIPALRNSCPNENLQAALDALDE